MGITKVVLVLVLGFIICPTNQIASIIYIVQSTYCLSKDVLCTHKDTKLKTLINKCSCPMGHLY